MDPPTTDDGKPYGPFRYRQIVKERYVISKNTYMSYEDTGKMTPLEREILIKYIEEDLELKQQQMEESQRNARANKANAKRPMTVPRGGKQ